MQIDSQSGAPAPLHTADTLTRFHSLVGRRVFVTGGGSGIGAAIVAAFAEQGARVAFTDINEAASRALCDELVARQLPAPWWQCSDVRDVGALQAVIAKAQAEVGDCAVLVNNVASDDRHRIGNVTAEYYDERMSVNERPAFFAIQAVLPGMQRLGYGSIINLGSTAWQTKAGEYPLYAMAKSSVNGLTRGLARELGAQRIRINTVSPGWVMTARQLELWVTPEAEQVIALNQCLPDRMQPADVARMVLFLASDDAAMCTAQEFRVDAGWA